MSYASLGLMMLGFALGVSLQAQDRDTDSDSELETWKIARDPVARLWQRAGETGVPLEAVADAGWLATVLKGLDVPVESQVLVFSKTSLQKSLIDPAKPRALYYNEDCYVGWVQGGEMEIVAADPEHGLQYYLVKRPFVKPARPMPVGSNQCLSCHVGGNLQMQSVHTRESGYPMGQADVFVTSYESPLSERWGGWYVTGRHGQDLHMGNVLAYLRGGQISLDRRRGANVESLEDWVSTQPYPAATSDIVALMVLEHQYVMHNVLHEAARSIRRVLNPAPDGPRYDAIARDRILRKRANEIVERLLFAGEYALKDRISGSPAFQNAFRRNRHPDSQGRSLKDFNLETRLFDYRCSYMIYSASFQGLPEPLKKAVYAELDQVLSRKTADAPDDFTYLPFEERQAIRQILLETDSGIQAVWKTSAP